MCFLNGTNDSNMITPHLRFTATALEPALQDFAGVSKHAQRLNESFTNYNGIKSFRKDKLFDRGQLMPTILSED